MGSAPCGPVPFNPSTPNREEPTVQITIDTNHLTDIDLRVLAVLSGGASPSPVVAGPIDEPAPASAADDKPAPKRRRATKKTEPAPDPAPSDDDNDAVTAEEPAEEPSANDDAGDSEKADSGEEEITMADAVRVATELVSNGRAKDVKAALADFGAGRVSELKGDDIAAFVRSF